MKSHPRITLWKKGVGLVQHNDGTKMYCPNIINGARHLLQIYQFKNYDPPPIEIEKDDVVVDIGGWIGGFMTYASHKVGPGGKIFVSEPLPHMFEFCALNAHANSLKNVVIDGRGIAGKDGERELHFLSRDPEMGYLPETDGHTHFDGTIKIKVVSLEEFVMYHQIDKIDFLKLNCEGAEGEIFQAIPKKLWGKIRKIALQIHEELSPVSGDVMKSILSRYGFEVKDESTAKTRWAYCWRK